MQTEYILLNGKYYSTAEKSLSHRNRGFVYGDALFETIHCLGTQAQFFDLHWSRLMNGMTTLKMIPGADLTNDFILKSIEKLLNKNRIFKGARVRLIVFREADGFYAPDTNTTSWLIETTALQQEKYLLNTKGLVVGIFDQITKPVNILSNLKTTNALIYILASIYKSEKGFDDCLILNQFGRIAESTSSNVFTVIGNKIMTPPLSEGCIEGTMRRTVLKIAQEIGYETEEKELTEKDLIVAEETFITNAIRGINWVGAYRDRRYYNFAARKLSARLNEIAFNS